MIREIALDTETTGLKVEEGHRVVELGCLELVNHLPTGRHFHHYLDPGRPMDAGATAVSGITDEMLVGKPVFADIADAFLEFIGDAPLVIHNASFDMSFLNAELKNAGRPALLPERAVDTLMIARRKFPGASASLDALCKRFNIDLSERTLHGALLDARLLADVYIDLIGARQAGLVFGAAQTSGAAATAYPRTARPRPLPPLLTEAEKAAHESFVARLQGEAIWKTYLN
jgi:DNA polymerase-3 subunit epsilon